MPNIEELIAQILVKVSERDKELGLSSIDLKYVSGKGKLHPQTSKNCIFTILGGHYQHKTGFNGLADMPVIS